MEEFLTNVIVNCFASLFGAIFGAIPFGQIFKKLVKSKSPIDSVERLYNSLHRYYITTKEELRYQIAYYVPQKFKYNGNEMFTAKEVLQQIERSTGDFYTITGRLGSGKTTAMRYLYCKLARKYQCVYFQMKNLKDTTDLRKYLNRQNADNNFKSGEKIIAFFDGVDEAIAFLQNEDFLPMFLKGEESGIYQLFEELNLNLGNVIISMRPEFLENSVRDLKIQNENVHVRILETAEMSDKDIIKVFKSLKALKKMEKGLPADMRRHQNRYPKKWAGKYIKFLKTTLESNPDSIFHYPLYIRYAYAFMDSYKDEYENQRIPYMQEFASDKDKASAFDTLVRAISKWEFHVYYKRFPENHEELFQKFYSMMQECMSDIVREMIENDEHKFISREQLQDILKNYCFNAVDGTEPMLLVISHCFMISDQSGKNFEFCHSIFYEYFLAKYLLEKGDFKMRKKYLLAENASEDFRHMYYGIFCMKKKELKGRISKSIRNFGGRSLSIIDCMGLRDETIINVVDEPVISMEQISEFLPEIQKFCYREVTFTPEQLEQIKICEVMDLSDTRWDYIRYAADAVIAPEFIKELNLCGLRLKDLNTIEEYANLKRLDIRDSGQGYFEYMQGVIAIIKDIALDWLYIYSEDGILCEQLNAMIEKGEFCGEKVLVDTPDYSEAYRKMYHLKQQAEQAGLSCHCYINKRSDLQNAQSEYSKSNAKKEHDLLKAVFEIEADEEGMLGLNKNNAEATFWNGLSLAEYYDYQDYTDEDEKAYQIYCRLEPFIIKDGSKLSAFYGKSFGENLTQVDRYEQSREWLTYANSMVGKNYFSEEDVIEIKLSLYNILLRCGEKDLTEYNKTLKTRIEKLPNYQQDWRYVRFLKYNCVSIIKQWKKGEEPPECLEEHIREYWRATELYAEASGYYSWLFTPIHYATIAANRMEKAEEAAKLLETLENVMPKANEDSSERNKQGNWIQYHEQKLYYLFLTNQNDEAVAVSEELINYPYRAKAKNETAYRYIQKMCTQNEGAENLDKHRLWYSIWY